MSGTSDDGRADATFPAWAYPARLRVFAGALVIGSRVSLLAMLYTILATHVRVTPVVVMRWFVLFFCLPALAARVVARGRTAEVGATADGLTVARAGARIDVPWRAIARIVPWRVPVPCAGFRIVLGSGRTLGDRIAADDPTPLLEVLAERGVPTAAAAATEPAIVYARARAAAGRWRWSHLVARFPLFALGPTAVLFNLHQHIAYGGTFGQYYMLGLGPYLETFAVYWGTVTIYQVLYASLWRAVAELVCFVAAAVAPSRAARVRRAAEIAIRVLYYGGVPALLALRLAPW